MSLNRHKKHRLLNPYSYRLNQLTWYYKNRGRLSIEIASWSVSDEELAERLKDEKLKSSITAPPNWRELFGRYFGQWDKNEQ